MKLPFKCVLFFALLICACAFAKDPGAVYIKNSGKDIMHLWVNGAYQGYIRPGETRYTVSDGFITQNSGNGRTGNPVKESHGGWENDKSGTVKIAVSFPGDKPQTTTGTPDERGDVVMSWNETDEPTPEGPTEAEIENAPAIIKGNKPNLKPSKKSSETQNLDLGPLVGTWEGKGTAKQTDFARLRISRDGTGTFETWNDGSKWYKKEVTATPTGSNTFKIDGMTGGEESKIVDGVLNLNYYFFKALKKVE